MRDYKHVTVPKSYRTGAGRTTVKRTKAGRKPVSTRKGRGGFARMLLKAAVLVAIAAAGYLFWLGYQGMMHDRMFVITSVDAKGVKQLKERELEKIASVFRGQNIFRVDIGAAIERARAEPWVKDVRIHRNLPNRITMVFTERVPVVVLDTGRAKYLLDDEGTVIERVSDARAWPLPVVAIRGCRARPGEQVAAEALPEAMLLLSEIAARGGWQLPDVTVRADTRDSISIVYAGHLFKMGSGRYEEKLRRLAEVMADVTRRGIDVSYVDLRPERQVAVMVNRGRGH